MKKLLGILLALALLLGCTVAFADPITLTYAEVNPIDTTVVGAVALAFKDKVEELSGGEILIDIQGNGVLGDEKTILTGIFSGNDTVDIVRISAFALNQFGAQKSVFLTLPFLFATEEEYWKFAESDLAKEFLAEAKEAGMPLTGLAYGEEGFRHFFLKSEAHGIADLKDMKIRVSDDDIMQGLVKDLGANPTTVSYNELYTSLQSGVVDAAEQPIVNYLGKSFQEVAPYLLKDGHTLGTIELIATDTCFAKLNEEQQGWIKQAAEYAMTVCKEEVATRQEAAEKELLEKGCIIIEVEDKTPWMEATKDIIERKAAGMEDTLAALREVIK